MSKPTRVKIGKAWFPVPNPWYLVGHPVSVTTKRLIVVDHREAMGSSDYSTAAFEFLREHTSLEAFWTLALHEATERLNDAFELEMTHAQISQLMEALGPFVCQWFYAQLEALADKPPEPPAGGQE